MDIWKYSSYDEYVKEQVAGNLQKYRTHSYVAPSEIAKIVNYILSQDISPEFGLCHGTRRGNEQQYFKEYFKQADIDVRVIGTEISHTALEFPDTIQWDFNKVKDEWISNVDFIYSNSFDHSFDPEVTINAWMSCLKPGGLCFIQWTADNLRNRPMDPIAGTLKQWVEFFSQKYNVKSILNINVNERVTGEVERNIIILENRL